ncbi:glycosyltransferase family 4 protein [Microvirga sp. STS02]|uniref:glycosyltransferase family 4 protein n=1 Tax=Hymenobacter negativus TaxID=2795026 RepID=UPI0018DCEC9A|nr:MULTISPECIES: glycosyltransferase family 4 protein [Bacteria]MBH8567826.1 glycosyltransferase family 4 protein [Hymenobacter negativus]MBR7207562.1 glycosyltransferase family 4 protein [Microvirga sp. STS02]
MTGALNALRHATSPLRDRFNFAYVLPTGSTGRAVLEADGYRVHELPFVEISRRPADLLLYLPMLLLNGWRLRQLARRERAKMLHLNDFYNLTGYVARWLSLGRLPVLTHVRFLPQVLPQLFARPWRWLAENAAQQVLCVSEAVRVYFAPGNAGVRTVYDPLPARGEAMPVYAVTSTANRAVRLLYLSNYIRGKGQNLALEAFQLAHARNPNLHLHFVGGDMGMVKNQEFRQELEDAAKAAGLAEVVHFDGFAANTEAAMKAHDIVLNFSEAESFSLTCLDALYYGVPLIATDCGGPAELFENGKSGLLVPNRDVPAMADAMVALAGNEALRQQFSLTSRAFVRQKFAPAHTYELLAGCYQQALARV